MQNEKKKKVTPTEKVMQYAHCLNWRPSEWKTNDGEEEDKNKSWLYNEIEFVNLHSLSIPVPESDCFHSMALTRFTIYSIVLCICKELLQLATYAISTYTIQFWNVDSWWNSDFLQSSDSIDLCSMNTWACQRRNDTTSGKMQMEKTPQLWIATWCMLFKMLWFDFAWEKKQLINKIITYKRKTIYFQWHVFVTIQLRVSRSMKSFFFPMLTKLIQTQLTMRQSWKGNWYDLYGTFLVKYD